MPEPWQALFDRAAEYDVTEQDARAAVVAVREARAEREGDGATEAGDATTEAGDRATDDGGDAP